VSAPERQFSRGNPTAGEASARLSQMTSELSAVAMPFEGYYTGPAVTPDAPEIQRALVVAPGDYDLYVVARERPRPGVSALKTAVMKAELTVPELTGDAPAMSSIFLADRLERVGRRLSPTQLETRPYVINDTELSVRPGGQFTTADVLSVVFFVYNLSVTPVDLEKRRLQRLPDVTVQYRFRAVSAPAQVFGEMEPQRFSRDGTTPQFDERAGRQLAVTQALPLTSFPPDAYELEVLVTDNLSGRRISGTARFTVSAARDDRHR
jgi:hypothetical protein